MSKNVSKKMIGKATPGPEPEHLKIDGDWRAAVGKALEKKRPPEGWPKPKAKGKRKKRQ